MSLDPGKSFVLYDAPDFLVVNKPSGFLSHQSNERTQGLQEIASGLLGITLRAAHRLDRDTSGALVLAKNDRGLRVWQERFRRREVQKTYIFLSTKELKAKTSASEKPSVAGQFPVEHESWIAPDPAQKGRWLSKDVDGPAALRSVTRWMSCVPWGSYFFHTVEPLTGRTHQIRLHARDLGVSVLGDRLYGVEQAVRLCLHAYQLEWTDETGPHFVDAPLPQVFAALKTPDRNHDDGQGSQGGKLPILWVNEIERRQILVPGRVKRLIHQNKITKSQLAKPSQIRSHLGSVALHWCVDQCDEVLVVQDYKKSESQAAALTPLAAVTPLTSAETSYLKELQKVTGAQHWIFRNMANRGQNPHVLEWLFSEGCPRRWIISENGVQYELRRDSGASCGIFLDQRINRNWVRENSKGLRVLNLFCYTGGFSVCAALGGASQVVSVDTSEVALSWAKRNFELNGLDVQNYEFFRAEVAIFMAGASKLSRQFDLIICDPPLARSKQKWNFSNCFGAGIASGCLRKTFSSQRAIDFQH